MICGTGSAASTKPTAGFGGSNAGVIVVGSGDCNGGRRPGISRTGGHQADYYRAAVQLPPLIQGNTSMKSKIDHATTENNLPADNSGVLETASPQEEKGDENRRSIESELRQD